MFVQKTFHELWVLIYDAVEKNHILGPCTWRNEALHLNLNFIAFIASFGYEL